MSSRDEILSALRRNAPPVSPLPDAPATSRFADPVKQFRDTLAAVGGKAVSSLDEVALDARRVISLVPGAGKSNVDVDSMRTPRELEGLDLAILPGQFAVAENAAVWVPGSVLGPHRAIFVIAQHLLLVVPAGEIVDTMQQAYERVRFERGGFGLFISGPSKTADIEQSLVIGAHGPRSCTVLLAE